jgi:hypothetical protein
VIADLLCNQFVLILTKDALTGLHSRSGFHNLLDRISFANHALFSSEPLFCKQAKMDTAAKTEEHQFAHFWVLPVIRVTRGRVGDQEM